MISRRTLVMSALAAGVLPGCAPRGDLLDEPFPVFESDVKEIPQEFRRQTVDYESKEPPGTVVVDTKRRYLYHLEGEPGKATRYGVGVGKAGRTWYGAAEIKRKEKWPVWVPTPEHIAEHPEVVKWIHGMPGGRRNPLGARALYLYQGEVDTVIRIHGAYTPTLIGERSTAGCISLLNIDVIYLYDRVALGTRVVILPPEA